MSAPHPLCAFLRTLREQTGLSIAKAAARVNRTEAVLGAYERGNRQPTVAQLDEVLRFYGWRLTAVPADLTDERLAQAIAWSGARQHDGPVELGAVA